MHLQGKIYAYPWRGHGNNCNTYLLAGEKNVLVDPGHIRNEFRESCLETLEKELAEDGFNWENIDIILCTHGHPDHFESAGTVRDKSGARVFLFKEEEPLLDAMARMFRERYGDNAPELSTDVLLDEGQLELGDIALEVIHTPGHSPGSACFYFPAENVLISGDTVFRGSIGRTDLPGGDMGSMKSSVDKLANLSGVELLLPGHMDPVKGEEEVKRNFMSIKTFFF